MNDPDDRHGRPPSTGDEPPPPPPDNPDDRHGHPLSLHLRIAPGALVGQAYRRHEQAVALADDGLGFIVTKADGSTIKVGPGDWARLESGDTLRVTDGGKN